MAAVLAGAAAGLLILRYLLSISLSPYGINHVKPFGKASGGRHFYSLSSMISAPSIRISRSITFEELEVEEPRSLGNVSCSLWAEDI